MFTHEDIGVEHLEQQQRVCLLACQAVVLERLIGKYLGGPPSLCSGVALQPSLGAALQAKAGAGDETRTRDVLLGKEVLYH